MNTTTEKKTKQGIKGAAGNLYIDDGGRGEKLPVVFLHSFAGSSRDWENQLNYLRKDRRAIAFDLRGHGRSDAPTNNDYNVESLANDLSAVVDSLGLDRFVLVGHSLGTPGNRNTRKNSASAIKTYYRFPGIGEI